MEPAARTDTSRMSNAERLATDDAQASANPASWTRRIALALVFVSLGYVVGVRSSWTAHHPAVVSGMAQRIPADYPMGYFDPDGGDRVEFRLDDVVWKAGDRIDAGSIPPCLRDAGARVSVQVGLIEVSRPYGSGSYQEVLSVTCPD
jgi:hypothetical protein